MKRNKNEIVKKVENSPSNKNVEENIYKREIKKKIKLEKIEESYENKSTYAYHYSLIEKECSELKKNLLNWYYKYKRTLPWRNDEPPYSTNIQMENEKNAKGILNYFSKKEKKETKEKKKLLLHIEEKKLEKEEFRQKKLDNNDENDLSLKGYRIYISEIMLQQTRVSTVLQYYLKWMEKWKTIFDLVNSDLNEVFQVWQGLGYYNRAKNLFECCKIVVEKYNGIFPNDLKLLKQLPGIGNYTAKAICIHLYNIQDICVDTNIIRIFSRITDVINYYNSTTLNKHCDIVSSILCKDEDKCSDLSQALMDLGSSLCNNSPQCSICPINKQCLMYFRKGKNSENFFLNYTKHLDDCELCIEERNGVEIKNIPLVKIKKKNEKICLILLIKKLSSVKSDECYLMKKNTDTNLFSMHYLFPFLLLNQLAEREAIKHLKQLLIDLDLSSTFIQEESFTFINSFKHKFSHLTYDTHIYLCSVSESSVLKDKKYYIWVKLKEIKDYTHNTFCQSIINYYKKHMKEKKCVFTNL